MIEPFCKSNSETERGLALWRELHQANQKIGLFDDDSRVP